MKKSAKVIDLAAKKHSQQVLEAFDKMGRKQKREQAEQRADVQRKARNTF